MTKALTWVNYSPERELASASTDVDLVLPLDGTVTSTNAIVTDGAGVTVEHVYVYLDLEHSSRGDLHIELISPAGTRSVLVPGPRPAPSVGESIDNTACGPATDRCTWRGFDFANDGRCDAPFWCQCDYADCIGQDPPPFVGWPAIAGHGPAAWNWKMATVRAWGESPVGTWRLEISDKRNPLAPAQPGVVDVSQPGSGPADCVPGVDLKCLVFTVFRNDSTCEVAEVANYSAVGEYHVFNVGDDTCRLNSNGETYSRFAVDLTGTKTVAGQTGCTDAACSVGCQAVAMPLADCSTVNEFIVVANGFLEDWAEKVVLTLIASGVVSDYADTSGLQQKVATAAGVSKSLVSITVTAGSVLITATIAVPATTTATAVQASLASALGTTADASTALGITVETVPTLTVASPPSSPPPLGAAPPPDLPPPKRGTIDGDKDVTIVIAAAGGGSAALLATILAVLYYSRHKVWS